MFRGEYYPSLDLLIFIRLLDSWDQWLSVSRELFLKKKKKKKHNGLSRKGQQSCQKDRADDRGQENKETTPEFGLNSIGLLLPSSKDN